MEIDLLCGNHRRHHHSQRKTTIDPHEHTHTYTRETNRCVWKMGKSWKWMFARKNGYIISLSLSFLSNYNMNKPLRNAHFPALKYLHQHQLFVFFSRDAKHTTRRVFLCWVSDVCERAGRVNVCVCSYRKKNNINEQYLCNVSLEFTFANINSSTWRHGKVHIMKCFCFQLQQRHSYFIMWVAHSFVEHTHERARAGKIYQIFETKMEMSLLILLNKPLLCLLSFHHHVLTSIRICGFYRFSKIDSLNYSASSSLTLLCSLNGHMLFSLFLCFAGVLSSNQIKLSLTVILRQQKKRQKLFTKLLLNLFKCKY